MDRELDVYLINEIIGRLTQDELARMSFTYDGAYLSRHSAPISFSMPLREEPYPDHIASPFFSGLLPDEQARRRLARTLGLSEDNQFGLLEVVGGECAGALSLLPSGSSPPDLSSSEVDFVSEKRLNELLQLLRQKPLLGGEQGIRMSLAGAQDKLAVCIVDNEIALPKQGRPTTHILKPYIKGLSGTVENELFCMELAARVGLNVPSVSKSTAGDIQFLLIERYDRLKQVDGSIQKLHQEDFCQAMSVPPALKYEADGGPGLPHSMDLIKKASCRPAQDILTFRQMVIFNYLAGNSDAHGKNFALIYDKDKPQLAPVYDVISTTIYPQFTSNMAMSMLAQYQPHKITLKHWFSLVPDTAAAKKTLIKELQALAIQTSTKSKELLEEYQQKGERSPVLQTIDKKIQSRSRKILSLIEYHQKENLNSTPRIPRRPSP
ncbi:type II toxin-antitoxin system HipA family toxin [Flexibacterium corallicola]|uniref:type II toxin-antitoxin system HipA family toxin n=1 Tax=Flexibacterium corallicola TaxID=3037259 RepID=UPI00286EBA1B|nr:type II toxin-antitoxin system HipA family toxin [Pseudovibrio sp. M1P-2-3]